MTWCSHRKGVNEGLSAAAALLAAIKADVLLLPHLSPPFTPSPPPFYSVRLVLVGLRQENIALCVCVVEGDVSVWCLSYLVGRRLQICPAIPAVITDRCALYACASRVLSLLHNSTSAAEDGSK